MGTDLRTAPTARVDRAAVATFLLVAFGAAWLIALPLWISGRGLATPGAGVVLVSMMLAPTIGVLAVAGVLRRGTGVWRTTGLLGAGGPRRWWRWGLLAWLGPVVLVVAAMALATAVGAYRPDLAGLSGLSAVLRGEGVGGMPIPLSVVAALQFAQILVAGWLSVIPALAEEWGWRGWLLPALLPFGRWPAILMVGAVWGLWHAPLLLLGYNYPQQAPLVRVLLMVAFCTAVGSALGWLRLRSGSVWPCAIGHGFVNAAAGLPVVFSTAGVGVHNATTGLLGWTGWVVTALAVAVAAFFLRGRAPGAPPGGADAPPVAT